MGKNRYINASLTKALAIMDLFSFEVPDLSLTEIAERLGLNSSSLYPPLGTLLKFGYLEQDTDTKRYSLGVRLLERGYVVQARLDIRKRATPFLEKLRMTHRENIHMGVLDGNEIVYIARYETSPNLPIESRIGGRAPAYCTALGKVLLAWAPTDTLDHVLRTSDFKVLTDKTITSGDQLLKDLILVEKRGYAIDDGEFQSEGFCIAVPVHDYRQQVVASISISMRRQNATEIRVTELIDALKDAGHKISKRLGYTTS